MMRKLMLMAVLLAVLAAPSSKLVCQVRQHRTLTVCWCKSDRPGGTWTTYPMLFCKLTGGK